MKALFFAVAMLASTAYAADGKLKSGTFDPPRMAPDFTLAGSDGSELTLKEYRGKVVALGFGFTNCPEICPTTLSTLAKARRKLGASGDGMQVVYVTVDPQRDSPEQMRKYLADSLVHWVRDFGVDGFRCDVGGGVPESFWNEARKALDKVNPDVVLLSESDRPDDQLQAFDINYNFQYYLSVRFVLRDGAPASKVRDGWQQMHDTMPRGARLLHYTDNHDWQRSVVQYGEKASEAANVLDFTLDGIPFVYNGQEVADPTATHWRGHAPIRWKDSGNSDDEKSIEASEAFYKKLFAMRAAEPVLTSGDVIWINNTEPDSVLSFLRKKGNDEVLVILNLSNRQVHVTIDLPVMDYSAVQNLLTPDKTWFQLYSGRVSANLDAFGYVVGKKIPLAPLKGQREPE